MISCKECDHRQNLKCTRSNLTISGHLSKQGCAYGKNENYDGVEIWYEERMKEVQFCYKFTNEETKQLDNFIRSYMPTINKIYPTYTILEVIHYVKNNYHKGLKEVRLTIEEIQEQIKIVYS